MAAKNSHLGKVSSKDLSFYVKQYKGVDSPTGREIEVRGYCEIDRRSRKELMEDFIRVLDAGDCYFQAVWDMKTSRFKRFRFNGIA